MVDYKRDKEEMMIELRGKAVADVHKAALQDKLQTLATQGITLKMAVLLVEGTMVPKCMRHSWRKLHAQPV